ncbi:alpha/beta fold hydrolase [Paraburkholderia megapolitana]|uniref:Pimeloyl-ACP methyl ester carboxylesterase n=1 Tax=Paraburkholderia megapolitana TaxID=420953 RepID=A0A1I3MNX1_9BURK|nr:alpha/beta fold hydrolase [Paraburkholderia megapolitana]SFI98659.1 Pimeloyl-ACP methyl ester carboxylesterase [Paraburkholderia megapolitana]
MTVVMLGLIAAAAICIFVAVGLMVFSAYVARRVEQAVPPRGKFVDIGADRIHYVDRGNGPPLVFIHGLSGQLHNFAYLPLRDLEQTHRVIVLDRPGSGYSVRGAGSSAGITAQAQTIARFIEVLGLYKPTIVGHSLGGAIALALGLNHPRSVGRLALIAPLTHMIEPPRVFTQLVIPSSWVRGIVSVTLAVPLGIRNGPAALKAVFAPEAAPKDFAMKGGGLLGLRPRGFRAASSDLVAVNDDLPAQERRYPTLRVPVDVLYGRGDEILDWRHHGEALTRKVDHATLHLVDGGHMLPITQPEMTMEWLRTLVTVPTTTQASHATTTNA